MARPTKIAPWTALAERLRAEACDSRPAFSAELHARICDAVWQCCVLRASPPGATGGLSARADPGNTGWQAASGTRRRRVSRRAMGLAGVAAAAASLLAAAVFLGPSRQPSRPMVVVKAPSPPAAPSSASPTLSTEPAGSESGFELVTDLTDRATEHFDSLVDAAGQWAYRGYDARLALESLSERLPISLVPMSSSEPSDPAEFSSGLPGQR
jgi:hypothetical protein